MAFDLFCNYKFKESMDVFFNLDICPSHVIGLFSGEHLKALSLQSLIMSNVVLRIAAG